MYQHYGSTPFDTVKGGTIWERHANLQAREYTPYCQFCGGEILDVKQNEVGQSVDPEWERLVRAHTNCYRKNASQY